MRRYIKDFSGLTDAELKLMQIQYPNGFDKGDYHVLKTPDGKSFEALEVQGDDAFFIVKVSEELIAHLDENDWLVSDRDLMDLLPSEE